MAIAHHDETLIYDHHADDCAGRIGPNAVIQLATALQAITGLHTTRRVFSEAGLPTLLDNLPSEMIDERIPAALFAALWQTLPEQVAENVAREAGRRTAGYILAHRIPGFAQRILRASPPWLAASLLLSAIQKNAWTFAGSGQCRTKSGSPGLIEIAHNPLSMPNCAWHQGVFERLFRELASHEAIVRHTHCCSGGDIACRFEVHLGS